MRQSSILLIVLLLACLCQAAEALEEGAIAEPSMPTPNMNMPTPHITSPNTGQEAQKASSQSSERNSSSIKPDEPDDPISGKWSARFEGITDRSLDLTLWSSGRDKIMGFGTLKKAGTETSMTASGSVSDNVLLLAVKSAQAELESPNYIQYDLDMSVENSTLTGTYILSSGSGDSMSGNATAIKR